jgi:hypothetical protein
MSEKTMQTFASRWSQSRNGCAPIGTIERGKDCGTLICDWHLFTGGDDRRPIVREFDIEDGRSRRRAGRSWRMKC